MAIMLVEAVYHLGFELMRNSGIEFFQNTFAFDDMVRLNVVLYQSWVPSPEPKRMPEKVKSTPPSSSRKRRVTAWPTLSVVSFLAPSRT